ncbi:MAG: MarR family winged helix-turn-helix transcriptional regulator [Planctomycetota bacterium]|jgi:DNA-binding MarR family transcriptional regulator
MDIVRDCLGFRFGATHRRLDRAFNRAYARLGLTHAHGQILLCILREGPLRVADVARFTGFEASTVSRLAKELSRRKLIMRKPNPGDGRSRLLTGAKRGNALRDDLEALHRELNARLRREIPEADLDGLREVTRILRELP